MQSGSVTTPDTNGTNTPQSYNWESLLTAGTGVVGSILVMANPSWHIPSTAQDTILAASGVLVALHVHVPKVVTHLFQKVFPGGNLTSAQSQLLAAAKAVAEEAK